MMYVLQVTVAKHCLYAALFWIDSQPKSETNAILTCVAAILDMSDNRWNWHCLHI